jgi:hypothetical protein
MSQGTTRRPLGELDCRQRETVPRKRCFLPNEANLSGAVELMIYLRERRLERRIFWKMFGFVCQNEARIGFLLALPTIIGAHIGANVASKPCALTNPGGWAMLCELGGRECKINHQ